MAAKSDEAHRIEVRAYHLWELEGRPHGRDAEFWDLARKLEQQEHGHALDLVPVPTPAAPAGKARAAKSAAPRPKPAPVAEPPSTDLIPGASAPKPARRKRADGTPKPKASKPG